MTLTSESSTDPHPLDGLSPSLSTEPQRAGAATLLLCYARPNGRIDFVNDDWRAFTGLSKSASRDDGWHQAIHPDDLPRWQAAWNAVASAGRPCTLICRIRKADNSFSWFTARAEAVRGAAGQISGWIGIATPLDAAAPRREAARLGLAAPAPGNERRLEPESLVALRQQQRVVAVAAHDMKNQLAVIRGIAQLAERHVRGAAAPEPGRILSALETIQSSTKKLQLLVEEFLDLSRVQSGEPVEFNQQPTDLVALARACVRECAETTGRELAVSSAVGMLVGEWDASRLERVIANLLSNATKYSASPSTIHLTIAHDAVADVAVLAVQDHGVGVPAADLPHIFEPFYRGSNVAQITAGTGLGLFGARALIEQQGGTLRLESTAGGGATLTVRLPLTPLPPADFDAPLPAPSTTPPTG